MFTVRACMCACLTRNFSLFVSNEHVVSNEHTAMTENKKKKIKSEEECLIQNGQINTYLQ